MPKTIVEKFNFSELKIEKVKLFTQSPRKKFCISVFHIGGCLASCLTFRLFSTLDSFKKLFKKRTPFQIFGQFRGLFKETNGKNWERKIHWEKRGREKTRMIKVEKFCHQVTWKARVNYLSQNL